MEVAKCNHMYTECCVEGASAQDQLHKKPLKTFGFGTKCAGFLCQAVSCCSDLAWPVIFQSNSSNRPYDFKSRLIWVQTGNINLQIGTLVTCAEIGDVLLDLFKVQFLFLGS